MKRKILSWLLMALLMATTFPGVVLGASTTASVPTAANTGISLEEAIRTAKQNFTIPAAFTQFTSSFDSSTKQLRWHLNWSAENDGSGNFSIDVDAATGEIVNLYRWSNSSNPTSQTPRLSVSEAHKIGQDLLNRLIPKKVGSLVLQDDNSLLALGDNQTPSCYMTWVRQYKNIPVSMDGASMEIDMQTGEVKSYNLNWTSEAFPDPGNVISSEKAQQAFVADGILQMQYRLLPSKIVMKSAASDTSITPLLIYGIRHPSNGIIDAVTGQPLTYYNDNSFGSGGGDKMTLQTSNAGAAPIPLTPEEQQEVNSVAKFISQEYAIKAVKQWLTIPANMELESASLEKSWQYPELRIWSLSWQVQAKDADKNSSLWAQVDASTGELLSFSLNSSADENKNNSISETTARNLAEAFIQKIQPQRWPQLKLDDMNATVLPLKQNQSSWSFNYLRLVNGVLCPDNGINVTVDANSQQIVQYNLNWSPAAFPSSSTALTNDKANATFLKAAPLQLTYMMLADKNGNQKFKLVYAPEFKNNLAMIDANSGIGLDSTGKPVSENPRAYVFNDIKDHFAAKEIAFLGQAGIFGEYGNSFHPNENISLISLLRAMLSSREGLSSALTMNDEEIFKHCQSLGWITADVSVGNSVSRGLLAQLMVRYLKIDYLAQIQGIYQLPYQDAGQTPISMKGYAALTYGLGIIKADGKYFNSAHIVTRGEAAAALVHTLSIKTQP